jgi:hypothetical protein
MDNYIIFYFYGMEGWGNSKHVYVDNIKMDLGEMGWGCVNWIGLAQNKDMWRTVVNAVMNLRVP